MSAGTGGARRNAPAPWAWSSSPTAPRWSPGRPAPRCSRRAARPRRRSAAGSPDRPDRGRYPLGSRRAAATRGSGGGLGPPPSRFLPLFHRHGRGGGIDREADASRQSGGSGEGLALPRISCSPSPIAMDGGEGVPASPAARCGRHFRTDTSPCQPSRWERGLGVRAAPGGPAARCGAASQRTPPPVSRIGGKVRGVAELVSAQAVGASRRPRGPRRAGQRRPPPAGRAGRAGRAPPGDRGGPGCRAPASPSPQVAGNATRRARRLPCR